jgi:four helix bundle protein
MDNLQLTISKGENVLKLKSYAFALETIKVYSHLQEKKREFVLSKQLLRSGTAIGALVEEANQAESKADFIHKLSIANKEANETQYWIRLLIDSGILDANSGSELLQKITELVKILTASIKTSKGRK